MLTCMSDLEQSLLAENARLRAQLAKLDQSHQAKTKRLEQENAYLTERLNALLARRFGASAERIDASQLALFDEDEAPGEDDVPGGTQSVEAHTRKPGGKRTLPAELERVEVRHELPAAQRVCPTDGTELEAFGEEVTEQLDIIPATVRVLRHIQVKYACPCCKETVVTAPKPKQPIPGAKASPGLLAHVAVSKYVDHLPLYRQGAVFERMGVVAHRSTMSQWMVQCGQLVQPLINLLTERLLEQPVIQMDETTVQVLKEPGKSAESQSYMWVRVSGNPDQPVILFDYDPTRARTVPLKLLEGFTGTLQVDGYAGYEAAIGQYGLTAAGCWAHARRRFDEVYKAAGLNPKKPLPKGKPPPAAVRRAARVLQWMRQLFAIEHRIRERPPAPGSANGSMRIGPRSRRSPSSARRSPIWTTSGRAWSPTSMMGASR